jgi:hypothetical protein
VKTLASLDSWIHWSGFIKLAAPSSISGHDAIDADDVQHALKPLVVKLPETATTDVFRILF